VPNVAPSFTAGADLTVLEDVAAQSVAWAASISPGPPSETSQSVSFIVSSDNPALFSAQPAMASDGTLSYTPAADANGAANVTVTAQDDGGTAGGGVDTSAPRTFTLTVSPVNDPPSFTAGPNQSVVSLLGAQSVPGWAAGIGPGPANEVSQGVTFTVSNDNPGLFAVQPSVAANGTLTYTPALLAVGSATVTVRAVDNGGTASGGSDTSPPQTFTISIL
jgi:large repetitive protein